MKNAEVNDKINDIKRSILYFIAEVESLVNSATTNAEYYKENNLFISTRELIGTMKCIEKYQILILECFDVGMHLGIVDPSSYSLKEIIAEYEVYKIRLTHIVKSLKRIKDEAIENYEKEKTLCHLSLSTIEAEGYLKCALDTYENFKEY
jgi:hypothetical protein